ncbi:hypothetical protein Nepgr_016704 [Nepenthes gracilis]|uniref:Uncharacterized protein n=1 Tax=Nepenthes gracilis TaxID=150966 RepID=A0AAD3XRU7_NEPGR|nr:hypothetical protein Nepgr_016704 [Nepenthes gracilis]
MGLLRGLARSTWTTAEESCSTSRPAHNRPPQPTPNQRIKPHLHSLLPRLSVLALTSSANRRHPRPHPVNSANVGMAHHREIGRRGISTMSLIIRETVGRSG